jgi:hypothetical protein
MVRDVEHFDLLSQMLSFMIHKICFFRRQNRCLFLFLFTFISTSKMVHCDISIHAYNIVWSYSPPFFSFISFLPMLFFFKTEWVTEDHTARSTWLIYADTFRFHNQYSFHYMSGLVCPCWVVKSILSWAWWYMPAIPEPRNWGKRIMSLVLPGLYNETLPHHHSPPTNKINLLETSKSTSYFHFLQLFNIHYH